MARRESRIVTVLALVCLLAGTPAQAEILLQDGFEYADCPTNHGWIFSPWGDAGSIYVTTDQAHEGLQCVFFDSLDGDEQRLTYWFTQQYTDVEIVFWMYDDLVTHNALVSPRAGPCIAYMGVRTPAAPPITPPRPAT